MITNAVNSCYATPDIQCVYRSFETVTDNNGAPNQKSFCCSKSISMVDAVPTRCKFHGVSAWDPGIARRFEDKNCVVDAQNHDMWICNRCASNLKEYKAI